jgi:2-polyprenyl-3-methyl-5-hydroxy-6-metoxy-1,4-benzoquinol methylase
MHTPTATVPESELARFEALYAEAERTGDGSIIPWDHDRPNRSFVDWLDRSAPEAVRCGSRVVVVGCGRGHDARELIRRGFEVSAFDSSESAIRQAKKLDPEHAQCYFKADLLNLPGRWRHRFELVVEIHTLQALPRIHRPALMEGLGQLVGANGRVLVISHAAPSPVPAEAGPPWAITEAELHQLAAAQRLHVGSLELFESGSPPRPRLRALLDRHAAGSRG